MPIDIEDAIQGVLNGIDGITAGASPLPRDFAASLPYAMPVRTGGNTENVIDTHSVSVDVYAATWAEATNAAALCLKAIRGMELNSFLGSFCYQVSANLPYNNPDPDNPTIPRVTFLTTIKTRGV